MLKLLPTGLACLALAGCGGDPPDDAGAGRTRGLLTDATGLGASAPEGAQVLLDASGDTGRWRHEKAPKEPIRWPFADGQRAGQGTCRYPDGSTYKGRWHADLRQGHGGCG